MQQQPSQNVSTVPSFPSANITTEQIQKLLEEKKKLIVAILENQNLGKLAECAQYQVVLQKNLMSLAAIADAQPPATPSTVPAQTPPHSTTTQQGNYMQNPQTAITQQQQQSPIFGAKTPFYINAPQSQPQQHQQQLHFFPQQQSPFQGQLGMRPGPANGSMYQAMQSGLGSSGNADDGQGNRQDGSDAPRGN